jgi:hypothetical protein
MRAGPGLALPAGDSRADLPVQAPGEPLAGQVRIAVDPARTGDFGMTFGGRKNPPRREFAGEQVIT